MKIVLDAGHGYNTNGKRTPDGSMREWEFNSKVAEYAKEYLLNYENVEVVFTHDVTGKTDIPLQSRTNQSNKLNVDVFVSIHANAFGSGGWNSAQGIETFIYTTKPREAMKLASYVQNQLLRQANRPNRGVKTANFHVLRETNMTAILVECGFMTNKEESLLLKSDTYRKKCALAIVEGLADYYKLKEKQYLKQKVNQPQSDYEKELASAIAWVRENKISNGERLGEAPTRAQLILMLYRALAK